MTSVAIYCRLSSEDKNKEGEQKDSESIQNQKTMLIEYTMQNSWEIYKIYSDEDYSGTDVSRPEWNALISDAKQKKFDIVLAKTQSRFIRDVKSMEYILHDKFPQWGVRFISLVDQMDTEKAGNKKARQITGLMNDWYVEDLSENLRAVLKSKKQQGKFVGAFAPYGYMKDPNDKNRLIIDPQAAAVVRKIYRMYMEGMGNTMIAKMLNTEGIPCPAAYKRQNGFAYKGGHDAGKASCWRDTTISLILRTQTYTGDMVQNKNTTISYKNQKKRAIPKAEWIIVPGTHEPIIDKETFEKARERSATRTRPQISGKKHLLAGKVKCGCCGSTLIKNGAWKNHAYLRCKVADADKSTCENGGSIPYHMLCDIILSEIKRMVATYTNEKSICDMIEEKPLLAERLEQLRQEEKKTKNRIEDVTRAMSNLYIDKIKETITEEQFTSISKQLQEEQIRLELKLAGIIEETKALQAKEERSEKKEDVVRKYMNMTELTADMVTEFVRCITVKNIGVNKKKERTKEQAKREIYIYWDM